MRSVLELAAVVALPLACSPSPGDGKSPSATPTAQPTTRADDAADPRAPGPPTRPGGTDELPRLLGRSDAELVAEFGEPTTRRSFTMDQCCTEFQIELYNTYPPDRAENAQTEVRELTWKYDGYALTAWLHEVDGLWSVLDTIRYSDDVEF